MARDGQHVASTGWPWFFIADLLPPYDDRHTVPTGSIDSFLNGYSQQDSPLTHRNSLGLSEEEMDSETGHMTADPKDQAWVPTT